MRSFLGKTTERERCNPLMTAKEKLADEILNALDDILQLDWNFEPVYKKKIMEALLGYTVKEKEQEAVGPQKL